MKYQEYFLGKTAIVTGAASGIGLALTEELLDFGAEKVLMVDYNKETLGKHVGCIEEKYPERVKGFLCDVTKEDQVKSAISEGVAFFGGHLDLLVNNAGKGFGGQFSLHKDVEAIEAAGIHVQTNENWEEAFALNFYGALYGCRAAIPIMLSQGDGQIINIISGIAFSPMPFQTMYAATKSALQAMTLALRAEYWEENILFSPATPGTTVTAIWEGSKSGAPKTAQTPKQSAQRILQGIANNDRIIYGDDADIKGAEYCYNSEYSQELDTYFSNIAQERKKGNAVI